MAEQHAGVCGRAHSQCSCLAVPGIRPESVQGQREKGKGGKLRHGRSHVQVHREIRHIQIGGGAQPASCFTEVQSRQQEHARRRKQHHHDAGQIHGGNEIEPEQVPEFAEIVDHRRAEQEEGLAGSAAQIGSPARHHNTVRDVLMDFHQSRKVCEGVVAPEHATSE